MTTANNESFSFAPSTDGYNAVDGFSDFPAAAAVAGNGRIQNSNASLDGMPIGEGKSFAASLDPGFETEDDGNGNAVLRKRDGVLLEEEEDGDGDAHGLDTTSIYYGNHIPQQQQQQQQPSHRKINSLRSASRRNGTMSPTSHYNSTINGNANGPSRQQQQQQQRHRARQASLSDSSTLTSTPSIRPPRPSTSNSTRTGTGMRVRSSKRPPTSASSRTHTGNGHSSSGGNRKRTSSFPTRYPYANSNGNGIGNGNTTLSTLPSINTIIDTIDATPSFLDNDDTVDVEEEYPLILLHCTLLPPSLSLNPNLPIPSESALSKGLPPKYFQRWKLLEDKILASGVLRDRGMLISHPEEDYTLLEERVFESLDIPTSSSSTGFSKTNNHPTEVAEDADGDNGNEKPFDLRIYAANGLMRAGAWRAAWREMEKVDVEICLRLPGDVRRKLEKVVIEEINAGGSAGGGGASPAVGYGVMPPSPMSMPLSMPVSAHSPTAMAGGINGDEKRKTMVRRVAEVMSDGRNCAVIGMGFLVALMAMMVMRG